jgi:hypothetical protein
VESKQKGKQNKYLRKNILKKKVILIKIVLINKKLKQKFKDIVQETLQQKRTTNKMLK